MNNRFLLLPLLYVFSVNANALPLPQVAVAVSSVWQLYLVLTALFLVAFPFLKKVRHRKIIVSGVLVAVFLGILGVIAYSTNSSKVDAVVSYKPEDEMFGTIPSDDVEEIVPGMVWDVDARKSDVNAISELKAYELQKSGDSKYIFLDARSDAETSLGSAKGFVKMRWADLYASSDIDLKGKTVIVSCWTGMRGSSVCAQLRARGIDCKYLSGGLEGWKNAGLPIELSRGVSLEQFGQAAPSPNFNNFLTASAVVSRMGDGVNLVDLRYLSEHKKNPFPGAVNISFNELTVPQIKESLLKLDKKPVVVLCYGSVSCGEATTFAWELDRLGLDFLGVYAGDKDYLKSAMIAGGIPMSSYVDFLSDASAFISSIKNLEKGVAEGVKFAHSYLPSWLVFLLCCVPLSILFYLSLRLGGSLDKGATKESKKFYNFLNEEDETLELREQSRGVGETFKKLKWTLLSVLILFFNFWIMMPIASGFLSTELFGVGELSIEAGLSLLAVIAGVLLGSSAFMVLFADAKNSTYVDRLMNKWLWCFVIVGVSLSTLSPKILLLIAIVVCLCVWVMSNFNDFVLYFKKEKAKAQLRDGSVSLLNASYAMSYDNKASNLSVLMRMGYPVPDGVVITRGGVKDIKKFKILNRLNGKVGVRSTVEGEDGLTESFAGCYKSVMPVLEGDRNLEAAIAEVFASYGDKGTDASVVLVQECVDAVISGTLFSKHPNWGGMLLVEWGVGLSGKRNDGIEDSHMSAYFRNGFELAWNSQGAFEDSIAMSAGALKLLKDSIPTLLNWGMSLEDLQGGAVNVEWAIDASGKLWLLQSRRDTGVGELNIFEVEREVLLDKAYNSIKVGGGDLPDDAKILAEGELSQVAGLRSMLSLSLVKSLWVEGSSADLGARLANYTWVGHPDKMMPYETFCGSMWLGASASIKEPGNMLINQALKEFDRNFVSIANRHSELMSYFTKTSRVNFGELGVSELLESFNSIVVAWKEMQMYAFYFEFMARSYSGILEKKKIYLGTYKSEFKFKPKSLLFVNATSSYELTDELNYERFEGILDICGELYLEDEGFAVNQIARGTEDVDYAYNTHLFLYLREKYRHDSVQMYGLLKKVMTQLSVLSGGEANIFELTCDEVADYCTGLMQTKDMVQYKNKYNLRARAEKAKEMRFNVEVRGEGILGFREIGFLGRKEVDYKLDESGRDKKISQGQSIGGYEAVRNALIEGGNYKVIPNSSMVDDILYQDDGYGVNSLTGDLVSGDLVATDSIKGKLLILREGEGKEELEARLLQGEGDYIVYAKAMTPSLIMSCMKPYSGVGGHPVSVVGVCTYYGSMLSHPAVLAREKSFPYFVKVS